MVMRITELIQDKWSQVPQKIKLIVISIVATAAVVQLANWLFVKPDIKIETKTETKIEYKDKIVEKIKVVQSSQKTDKTTASKIVITEKTTKKNGEVVEKTTSMDKATIDTSMLTTKNEDKNISSESTKTESTKTEQKTEVYLDKKWSLGVSSLTTFKLPVRLNTISADIGYKLFSPLTVKAVSSYNLEQNQLGIGLGLTIHF
jgi:hypothetical protein